MSDSRAGGTNSKAASLVPTASGFAFAPTGAAWAHGIAGYRTDNAGAILPRSDQRNLSTMKAGLWHTQAVLML
jgi:hypothetical protein